MTPACKVLKSSAIEFSIHEYEHDVHAKSFGLEAAQKLNLDVREVFKTLANLNMRCDSFKSLMIINKLSKFL